MDDPRDFIDSDEGRDIDWDSHLDAREPFFAYALPCESCGRPVDGDRLPGRLMPELISQGEAELLASLSAWYLYEWNFFCLLANAGFQYSDIQLCMTMDAS